VKKSPRTRVPNGQKPSKSSGLAEEMTATHNRRAAELAELRAVAEQAREAATGAIRAANAAATLDTEAELRAAFGSSPGTRLNQPVSTPTAFEAFCGLCESAREAARAAANVADHLATYSTPALIAVEAKFAKGARVARATCVAAADASDRAADAAYESEYRRAYEAVHFEAFVDATKAENDAIVAYADAVAAGHADIVVQEAWRKAIVARAVAATRAGHFAPELPPEAGGVGSPPDRQRVTVGRDRRW
jgi:hypothetical protein